MKIMINFNANEISYLNRTAEKIAALVGKTYDPSLIWRTNEEQNKVYESSEVMASDGSYIGNMIVKSEFIYDLCDITAESVGKFYTIGNQIITLAKAIGVDFKGFGISVKTRMKKWVDEEKAAEKYNARFYTRARKMVEKSAMRVMRKDDMQEGTLYTLTGISEDKEWHTWTGTGDDFIEFATGEAKKVGVEKFHTFKAEIKHGSMISFTEIEIKKAEPAEEPKTEDLPSDSGEKPYKKPSGFVRGNIISGVRKAIKEAKVDDVLSDGTTILSNVLSFMDNEPSNQLVIYIGIADLRDHVVVCAGNCTSDIVNAMYSEDAALDNENLKTFMCIRIDPLDGSVMDMTNQVIAKNEGRC